MRWSDSCDVTVQTKMDGFTLIELLVVIFIISIVTSVALLSFANNEKRDIESLGKAISEVLQLAQDRAMLRREVLGVNVTSNEINFLVASHNVKTHQIEWKPLNDDYIRTLKIPLGLIISIQPFTNAPTTMKQTTEDQGSDLSESDNMTIIPQSLVYPNRNITPFNLFIGHINSKPDYMIQALKTGEVKLQEAS